VEVKVCLDHDYNHLHCFFVFISQYFDLNSFLQLEDSNDFSKVSVDESSFQASIKNQDAEMTGNLLIYRFKNVVLGLLS
jgi:hypothetical protein